MSCYCSKKQNKDIFEPEYSLSDFIYLPLLPLDYGLCYFHDRGI